MSASRGGAEQHPEETEDRVGTFIHGEERDEGVGELTPLPADAGGDTPPERDLLAEIEAATGNVLSDDLTAEATQLGGDDAGDGPDAVDAAPHQRYAGS